jgi:hypothetical protein
MNWVLVFFEAVIWLIGVFKSSPYVNHALYVEILIVEMLY